MPVYFDTPSCLLLSVNRRCDDLLHQVLLAILDVDALLRLAQALTGEVVNTTLFLLRGG